MANWNNDEKKKELMMVKECVSIILKQKEKYLTSGIMKRQEFDVKMGTLFPSFIANYGSIYKMTISNDDIGILYKMLDGIFDICDGKQNFNDVRNGFGNLLAAKYLPPNKKN